MTDRPLERYIRELLEADPAAAVHARDGLAAYAATLQAGATLPQLTEKQISRFAGVLAKLTAGPAASGAPFAGRSQ